MSFKKRLKAGFTVLFFVSSCLIFAQESKTNLVNLSYDSLNVLFEEVLFQKPDSAIYLANIFIKKAESEKDELRQIEALNMMWIPYILMNKKDIAEEKLDIALEKSIKLKDKKSILITYSALAGTYLEQNRKVDSYKTLIKALDLADDLEDFQLEGRLINNLGVLNLKVKNYELAEKQFEEMTVFLEANPDLAYPKGVLELNKGEVQFGLKEYHDAIAYFNQAKKIFTEENKRTNYLVAMTFESDVYKELGKVDKAISLLEEAIAESEELNHVHDQASNLLKLAELYICLLYTSPSPRDRTRSRMPSSA